MKLGPFCLITGRLRWAMSIAFPVNSDSGLWLSSVGQTRTHGKEAADSQFWPS